MSDELILKVFSDKAAVKTASELAKKLSQWALKESRVQIGRMDRQVQAAGNQKAVVHSR